jgi:hypothetical protein
LPGQASSRSTYQDCRPGIARPVDVVRADPQAPGQLTYRARCTLSAGQYLLVVGLRDGVGVEGVDGGVQLCDCAGERVAGGAEPVRHLLPAHQPSRRPGVNDARRLVGRFRQPLQPGPTGPATLAHQVQKPLRPRVGLDGKCVQKVKR